MPTKKKKNTDIIKVVADSDKPCPPKAESIDFIKDAIYTIRGVKVMLDADLAEIYGYTTKAFNQQVKNNIEKFDAGFRFQLTKEEYHQILKSKILTSRINTNTHSLENNNIDEVLRSKNLTFDNDATNSISSDNRELKFLRSNFLTTKAETRGGRQYLPFVFTEQGIHQSDRPTSLPSISGRLASQSSFVVKLTASSASTTLSILSGPR